VVVDTTIVNVITPSLIEDLGIDSSSAQWVQESYAIVFAAVLLLAGRLADLLGARFVFLVGVVGFALTSALAGLAPDGGVLIAARFLQGIAGAAMLPTSLSLLNQTFTGKARGQAFAVWGSTIGAATAVGPVIGGWLAENSSWRWAFGINPPVAVAVVVLAVLFLDRSPRRVGSIDAVGSVLSIIGLGGLAFALIEGRTYGWVVVEEPLTVGSLSWSSGISPVLVALVLAAVTVGLFVLRQVQLARPGSRVEPLMDVRLFRVASFRNGNIATVLIGLGEFGIIAVIPLWLQFTLGYTALQSGAALLPLAVGSFIASGLSFGLSARLSSLTLVRIGLALEALALAGLAAVGAYTDASWWWIAIALAVYGVGIGFATAQVTNVVLADVPPAAAGQASGIQSTTRQLGSALGIAALTTTFYSVVQFRVISGLTDVGVPSAQVARYANGITDSAGALLLRLQQDPALATVVRVGQDALTQGVAVGALLAAGFLVIGVIATLLIPRPTPPSNDRGTGEPLEGADVAR
jgi:EmrB/QacA subfamily drug resistance transporter